MKYIDLFSGMGSFHYAMKDNWEGHECVLACDINSDCRDTYKANYGVEPKGDIKLIKDVSQCDILFAGTPCPSFSSMGKRLGLQDERGQLINEVFRIVKLSNPSYVVIENVKNILKFPEAIDLIKQSMHFLDYDVTYKVLKCWEYGIPQNRERVFFVCVKKGLPPYTFPEPLTNSPTLSEYLNKPFVKDRINTIRTAGWYSKIDDRHNWSYYETTDGSVYHLMEEDIKYLQGFPKDFTLCGGKISRFKQLGNTIPTCLSKAIVSKLYLTRMF